MFEDTETIMISALQHYSYCPRQFALIHVEQVWEENFFTAHGKILHQKVDSFKSEQKRFVRIERSVSVKSEQLCIVGRLDQLEINKKSTTQYFPVEYKRGKSKIEDWDKIQLCAQAMCLEEMHRTNIEMGALWYWQIRKREIVLFDDDLRINTLAVIDAAHCVLNSGITPPPIDNIKRCKACSLVDLCEPFVFRNDQSKKYINALFSE